MARELLDKAPNTQVRVLMHSGRITCENLRAREAPCGESALVHMIHYVYSSEPAEDGASTDHILRETHFDIECPRCGRRTQIEVHDS
jgi:hypothetical protein